MIIRTVAVFLLLSVSWIPMVTVAEEAKAQKAVLITGATSGIGRMAAERLAKAGYFVYAGARKQADMDELNAIDNIKAVRLDVTVQSDIDAAVELISKEGRGLWGLVNNAGVNFIEPLIEVDDSTMEFIFDINVYGVIRVTRAFAPMIIESKGRIVNISSIAGVLSGGLTGYGLYVMSKHAVEAFTDQLAWEMADLGVKVSAVEPGNFASRIGVSRCARMLKHREKKKYRYFQEQMDTYFDGCEQRMADPEKTYGPEPVPVAAAIEHALFNEKPKEHYLVVGDPFEAQITIGKLMEELVHMNHDHDHSFTREQLIEMLDSETAIIRGEKARVMPGRQ